MTPTPIQKSSDPSNRLARHLSESQRAMVAARIATMRSGVRTDLSPIGERSVSRAEAAQLLNVGTSSVDRARRILKLAEPELVAATSAGDPSMPPDDPSETPGRRILRRGTGRGRPSASRREDFVCSGREPTTAARRCPFSCALTFSSAAVSSPTRAFASRPPVTAAVAVVVVDEHADVVATAPDSGSQNRTRPEAQVGM